MSTHKTAITRKSPSRPMKWLDSKRLVKQGGLDFGCGKGFDASYYGLDKYDPYFQPQWPTKKYHYIYCNYVLNTLEPLEWYKVLKNIRSLLTNNGIAFVSVRRDKGVHKRQYLVRLPENLLVETSSFAIYEITKKELKSVRICSDYTLRG